jgi:hypothetical protein
MIPDRVVIPFESGIKVANRSGGNVSGIWSDWRPFPDPKKCGILIAPFGAGCYELRLGDEKILFGSSKYVALRMTSLLPRPYGAGTRRNTKKREFVLTHLQSIEYRTLPCVSGAEAKELETEMRAELDAYWFST